MWPLYVCCRFPEWQPPAELRQPPSPHGGQPPPQPMSLLQRIQWQKEQEAAAAGAQSPSPRYSGQNSAFVGSPRGGCMFGCRLHRSYTRVLAVKCVSKASCSSAAALAVQQLAQGPPCIGCMLDSALHDLGIDSFARSDHGADAANDTDGTQPSARRAPGIQPGNATSDTVSFQCRHPPAVGAVWSNV